MALQLDPGGSRGMAAVTTPDLMDLVHRAGFQHKVIPGTNLYADRLVYALALAESGGHASAHNQNGATGDNSYGLLQINMLGSMGPSRLAQFGLSNYNQLLDPLTNLRAAYKMTNGGVNFGAWGIGPNGYANNNKGQLDGWTRYYGHIGARVVDGGTGAGGGMAAASGAAAAVSAAPPSKSDFIAALGDLSGLIQAVPSLRGIVNEAVSGGWTTDRFMQAVQGTDWWKHHSSASRTLISLRFQDPAEYHTQIRNAQNLVRNTANQMGVALTPQQVQILALRNQTEVWDAPRLQEAIGFRFRDTGTLNGQAASWADQLQKIYGDQGLPLTRQAKDARVRQLLEGTTTVDTFSEAAKVAAQAMYPGLSHQLNSGLTVRDIADPYVQAMGGLLEIDPQTIALQDPMIKKALQGSRVTTGGKTQVETTPLYQFETGVRSDPRWGKTQNAKDTMSSALLAVGRDFGFEG